MGNDGYDSTTSLAKYKKKAAKVLGGRSASSDISLSNIVRIAAGKEFSAALKSNGMIVVWGNNEYGQLGINANGLRNQPVKVITRNSKNLENVIDISLGANHALALTFDNSLYAWGANDRRQQTMRKERDKVRRETLGKFFFDLAKLMFTTMVLGEMLLLAKDIGDINNWGMLNIGILGTYLLARVGNRILK